MTTETNKPLGAVKGLVIAAVSMWLLGGIGVWLACHFNRWLFFVEPNHPSLLLTQVLGFYAAFAAAKLPSAVFAGYVVAYTDVRRPYMAAVSLTLFVQLLMFAARLFRWPWSDFAGLSPAIPAACEIGGVVLLAAVAALGVAWPRIWSRLST